LVGLTVKAPPSPGTISVDRYSYVDSMVSAVRVTAGESTVMEGRSMAGGVCACWPAARERKRRVRGERESDSPPDPDLALSR
jgi:hypothetical protein